MYKEERKKKKKLAQSFRRVKSEVVVVVTGDFIIFSKYLIPFCQCYVGPRELLLG